MKRRTRRLAHPQAIDVEKQREWIGQTLRDSRERRNLTAARVALASSLPVRTIERAEAGGNVTLDTLIRIAWVTGARLEVVPGPPLPVRIHYRPVPLPWGERFWRALSSMCEDRGISMAPFLSRRRGKR